MSSHADAELARRTEENTELDRISVAALLAGLALLYLPSYFDLLLGKLAPDAQGHEPIFIALTLWLLYRQREAFATLPNNAVGISATLCGSAAALVGLLAYVAGRTQDVVSLELGSPLLVLAAAALFLKGWAGLRLVWFPILLLFFVIPLPYSITTMLTGPMKQAVSAVATWTLRLADYPVGRSGVVITVGQYQLLVAEACAGLQTMFTLEAMGLLFTHLMNYRSAMRNALMALLVVPLSFCANVIRVIVLIMVTYHFGDTVGQGFVHRAAGLLLFAVALALIGSADRLLGRVLPEKWAH